MDAKAFEGVLQGGELEPDTCAGTFTTAKARLQLSAYSSSVECENDSAFHQDELLLQVEVYQKGLS